MNLYNEIDLDVDQCYGNAIVPQLAAMFIKSVMEWIETKEVEE